jgi:hypothetical protein
VLSNSWDGDIVISSEKPSGRTGPCLQAAERYSLVQGTFKCSMLNEDLSRPVTRRYVFSEQRHTATPIAAVLLGVTLADYSCSTDCSMIYDYASHSCNC